MTATDDRPDASAQASARPRLRVTPRIVRRAVIAAALIMAAAAAYLVAANLSGGVAADDPDRVALEELGFTDIRAIAAPDQTSELTDALDEMAQAAPAVATWERTRDRADLSVTGQWETAVLPDGNVVWRFHDLTVTTRDDSLHGKMTAVTAAPGPVTLTARPTGDIDGSWQLCDRQGQCLNAEQRSLADEDDLDLPIVAGASIDAWEMTAGRTAPWRPERTGGLLDPSRPGPRRILEATWPVAGEVRCLVIAEQDDQGFMRRHDGGLDAAVICHTSGGSPVAAGPLLDDGAGHLLSGLTAVDDPNGSNSDD